MADTFTPPQSVRDAAERGLRLRRKYERGGTEVGVARARDLKNGKGIPLDTVKRMASFFARHDNELERAARKRDETSAASIAWSLWGGDPGRRWAQGIVDRVTKEVVWSAAWAGSGKVLTGLAKSAPDVGDVHAPAAMGSKQPQAGTATTKDPDPAAAEVIARQHLERVPDYYSRLRAAGLEKKPVTLVAKLADTDDEQRLAYYVASVAEEADGTVVVDLQNDRISPEELESAAHTFLLKYRSIGDRHARWGGIGEVVASFVTTRELQQALAGLPGAQPVTLPVAWVLGLHITDDGIWGEVKDGTLAAMSIGGSAVRNEVAQ